MKARRHPARGETASERSATEDLAHRGGAGRIVTSFASTRSTAISSSIPARESPSWGRRSRGTCWRWPSSSLPMSGSRVGVTPAASSTRPPRRTHRQRVASRDGYFAPESVIRRVGNEPLVPLLGGGPAVLLQVAHPLVAAGVVRHSGYEDDLWKRFMRTMEALYLIVYGNRREADRAGEIVRAVHAAVRGRTDQPLGLFPAGTVYSAADPELMLWVHATLVETSLAIVKRFAGALTEAEQEAYYREMGVVARVFGMPPTAIPRTLADFREYLAAQLGGPKIVVTAPARDVAGAILRAPLPGPVRAAAPAHRLATAAFLPERLRREYGLRWSPAHAAALELSARPLRLAAMALLRAAERVAPSPTLEAPVRSLAA